MARKIPITRNLPTDSLANGIVKRKTTKNKDIVKTSFLESFFNFI